MCWGHISQAFRCLVFIVSCAIIFVACAKSPATQKNRIIAENSLEFVNPRPTSQAQDVEQSENLQELTVSPSGVWSAATSVWETELATNLNTKIIGPRLSVSDLGPSFLSIDQSIGIDPLSGDFAQQRAFALSTTGSQISWQNNLPYPVDLLVNTTDIKIKNSLVSGAAYAIWQGDGSLYINQQNVSNRSEPPCQITVIPAVFKPESMSE